MNRKPIFDAVRRLLTRGFTQAEVATLDRAIDAALAPEEARVLGALSEVFESGGRGPGAVSSGKGDPGGVSYGIWQLSSVAGTAAAFVGAEGAVWREDFAGARPGSPAFSDAWRAVAARESDVFAAAQRDFIERTHYRPAVAHVLAETGMDLHARHIAVRDATWSTAVQHGKAAKVLGYAVKQADRSTSRLGQDYDKALVRAIYGERAAYVRGLAARASSAAERRTLENVAAKRFPAELTGALAMFD